MKQGFSNEGSLDNKSDILIYTKFLVVSFFKEKILMLGVIRLFIRLI